MELNVSVTPQTIRQGESALLSWHASGADTVTMNGEVVPATGSRVVSPHQSTTWRLVGSTTREATAALTVLPPEDPPDDHPPHWHTHLGRVPDWCHAPTIQSVRDGSWSSPETWAPARVPVASDRVHVAHSVIFDAIATVHSIKVTGWLVWRRDASTVLRVHQLVIPPTGGRITIGSEHAPIERTVSASLVIRDGPLDSRIDPDHTGQGILILGGIFEAHGARVAKTHVMLEGEPVAGDWTLLADADNLSDWLPGDRLYLPDTRHLDDHVDGPGSGYYQSAEEMVEIAAVSPNGREIHLRSPLRYQHPGARTESNEIDPLCMPRVAHLTRSVMISSERPDGTRGHIAFTGNAAVDLGYVAIINMGRTTIEHHSASNRPGRYPLHWHHCYGPSEMPHWGEQHRVQGCVIMHSTAPSATLWRWGISIHDTHWMDVEDCIIIGPRGAGIVLEQGNETEVCLMRNYIARVRGISHHVPRVDERPMPDVGFEGAGIWDAGYGVGYVDNVVYDSPCGYLFSARNGGTCAIPLGPGLDTHIASNVTMRASTSLTMHTFIGNDAAGGVMRIALQIWNHGAGSIATPNIDHPPAVIQQSRFWHVNMGYYNYVTSGIQFHRCTFRGSWEIVRRGTVNTVGIFGGGDYVQEGFQVSDCVVTGFMAGIIPSAFGRVQKYTRCHLCNYHDVIIMTRFGPSMQANQYPSVSIELTACRHRALPHHVTEGNPGWAHWYTQQPAQIWMDDRLGNSISLVIAAHHTIVRQYQGNEGDDFHLYFPAQAQDAVLPETRYEYGYLAVLGAPEAGRTNAQAMVEWGICRAGAIAPLNAVQRPGIIGLAAAQ